MIERNGQRFYTSADVNYDRVHEAMRKVGDDLMRAQFPDGVPKPPAHDYGPHVDEDPRGILRPVGVKIRGLWHTRPVDPAIFQQRATINARAHKAAREWDGR